MMLSTDVGSAALVSPGRLTGGNLGSFYARPSRVGLAVLDRQPGGSGGEVVGSGVPAFAAQFGNTDQAPSAAL